MSASPRKLNDPFGGHHLGGCGLLCECLGLCDRKVCAIREYDVQDLPGDHIWLEDEQYWGISVPERPSIMAKVSILDQ